MQRKLVAVISEERDDELYPLIFSGDTALVNKVVGVFSRYLDHEDDQHGALERKQADPEA